MKLRQPSLGTKAAIFLPFLMSCTRAHFRIAELGCLASIPLHRGTAVAHQHASPVVACNNPGMHHALEAMHCWDGPLTSSPGRCPWRVMRLQRASSTRFQDGSSCSPYLPTSSSACGCGACVQLQDRASSCHRQQRAATKLHILRSSTSMSATALNPSPAHPPHVQQQKVRLSSAPQCPRSHFRPLTPQSWQLVRAATL